MHVLLYLVIIASVILCSAPLTLHVDAQLHIPDTEYVGYFDAGGTYTVVGAIKNTGDAFAEPTVTVIIHDNTTHRERFTLAPIAPHSELPFKIRLPHLNLTDPALGTPGISYDPYVGSIPMDVDVIYDDSLVLHQDGHQTGRIINNGNETAKFVRVYALIYSEDGVLLDMGQSMQVFESVMPGQTRDFSIYPDPSVASQAKYYSCFAVGDSSIIKMDIMRKGISYPIRYDSGAWFAYPAFDNDGTTLTMKTQNSFPLAMMTNFEFPRHSDSEKFTVTLNGKPAEHRQSLDEMGNWHVIFDMPPHTSGFVTITGFEDMQQTPPFDGIMVERKDGPDYMPYYIAIPVALLAALAGIVTYRKRRT